MRSRGPIGVAEVPWLIMLPPDMSEPETPHASSSDASAATAEESNTTRTSEADEKAAVVEVVPAADPLAEARADVSKMRDQLLRTAADFDNYRKRARREVEDAQKKGSEDLLRVLLPVFDNLERAVVHAGAANDAKAIADGVRMVLKQFVDTLARAGIHRVAGVGTPFDPLVHEAIQQVETADHPVGTVVAEVAPGYKLGDKLVRAAMVVVAKPVSSKSEAPSA